MVALRGDVAAEPGGTVVVPLSIDKAAGLESVRARVTFDASRLQFVQAKPALTADFAWRTVRTVTNRDGTQTLEIDLARLQPMTDGAGSLVDLEFRVQPNAPAGGTLIDLQYLALNDTHVGQSVASVPGEDPTDAIVRVLGEVPPPKDQVRLPAAPAAPAGELLQALSASAARTVNWGATFAAAEPAQPAAVPAAVPVEAVSVWRADAWARDLGTRLASVDDSTPPTQSARDGLLKQLVRGISRTLRG